MTARYRAHPLRGLLAAGRWIVNPVSSDGAASIPKITYAVGGPDLHRKVTEMRAHRDGARILAERPDLVRAFHCTSFEELLPRQLADVGAEWGIEPLPAPLETTTWLGNPLAQRMADGYADPTDGDGNAQFLTVADRLVHAGVPVKRIVNLDDTTMARLVELAAADAPLPELLAAAASQAAVAA